MTASPENTESTAASERLERRSETGAWLQSGPQTEVRSKAASRLGAPRAPLGDGAEQHLRPLPGPARIGAGPGSRSVNADSEAGLAEPWQRAPLTSDHTGARLRTRRAARAAAERDGADRSRR